MLGNNILRKRLPMFVCKKSSLTHPISHRATGNFSKVFLLSNKPTLTSQKHFLFAILCHWLNKSSINSLITINMTVNRYHTRRLYHFTAYVIKGSRPQMCHIKNVFF